LVLLTFSAMSEPGRIHLTIDGAVASIVIDRTHARNAFTLEMYGALKAAFETVHANRDIRAAIISGAGGKAFSSGTDIACFETFRTAEDVYAYEAFMEDVLHAIETCRVPVIAAISGACTGGGAAIASACDIRLATADAAFGFPIARTLGNCLSVANLARVAALVGEARLKEMIFTARLLQAEEGKSAGLYSDVLPDLAALQIAANELAAKLSQHAPLTLQATKEGLRRVRHLPAAPSDDLIGLCYTSADFREGMSAFLSKRKPVWRGE
jgi:enoyl-CoA hydratase/carnithine racemase